MEGLEGRPGFVRGQLEDGKRAVQLLLPELNLFGIGGFIEHHVPLPQGKIPILHGQLGWTRFDTLGERPIKRVQLVQQQPNGQSVRHDVMQVDD